MTALTIPAFAFATALTVLVFTFGVRRLMGLPLSPLRTLIAGLIAFFAVSPIATAIGGPAVTRRASVLPKLWFIILGVVIAVLVGMIFLVIAEALVPSGSMPGPIYVLRRVRRLLSRAGRYWQISRILVRRGLLPYLRGGRRSELATADGRARLARPLRLALEDGGVTFVKLGQIMSTRGDLLPAEFISERSRLRDDAPQVPWPGIEEVLRSGLGAGVDEVFGPSTVSPSPRRPSPRSMPRRSPPGPGWWSRCAGRTSTRSSNAISTSLSGWRAGCSAARTGAGPSAPSSCPTGSPARCAKSSTCGSKHAI
jgi:ubiquinone biosynthesis protein